MLFRVEPVFLRECPAQAGIIRLAFFAISDEHVTQHRRRKISRNAIFSLTYTPAEGEFRPVADVSDERLARQSSPHERSRDTRSWKSAAQHLYEQWKRFADIR